MDTKASESHQRRRMLVDDASQFRLIRKVVWILLALVVISGVCFFILAQRQLGDEYYSAHSKIGSTMQLLLPFMVLTYVVGGVIAFWLTIVFTRRLAGPILRLKREGERIASGNFDGTIRLRRNDELQELSDTLNRINESHRQHLSEIASALRDVLDKCERLQVQETSAEDFQHVLKQIMEIRETLDNVKNA